MSEKRTNVCVLNECVSLGVCECEFVHAVECCSRSVCVLVAGRS